MSVVIEKFFVIPKMIQESEFVKLSAALLNDQKTGQVFEDKYGLFSGRSKARMMRKAKPILESFSV